MMIMFAEYIISIYLLENISIDVICILQIIQHWSFMMIEKISQILYYILVILYTNTQILYVYREVAVYMYNM